MILSAIKPHHYRLALSGAVSSRFCILRVVCRANPARSRKDYLSKTSSNVYSFPSSLMIPLSAVFFSICNSPSTHKTNPENNPTKNATMIHNIISPLKTAGRRRPETLRSSACSWYASEKPQEPRCWLFCSHRSKHSRQQLLPSCACFRPCQSIL